MITTDHGHKRCIERAIPPLVLDWLIAFGRRQRTYGCTKFYFDKRSRRELMRAVPPDLLRRFESKLDTMAVVADSGALVTVAYRRRRIKT